MARLSWAKAKIYKYPSRKSRAHYQAIRAGYAEWRERAKAEYAAYLETSWWKTRRASKLKQAGYKCEKCKATSDLQVHHKSYQRLYKEKNKDLQVLCRPCHEKIHDIRSKHRHIQRHYETSWKV